MKKFKKYMCLQCGFIYDEEKGFPDHAAAEYVLPPGTLWENVPFNWICPECGARKEEFDMVEIGD